MLVPENFPKLSKKWSCPEIREEHKIPHRKGIDQGIIKGLIAENALRAHLAFAAFSLRGFRKAMGRYIDANTIFACCSNERFGIDGSGEVHMQIGALGHGS